MFKKKPKDREEDVPAPSSPTVHSYGGQPVVTGEPGTLTDEYEYQARD